MKGLCLVAAGAYFATQGPAPGPGPTQTATSSAAILNPDTLILEIFGQPEYLDPGIDYDIPGLAIIQNVYEPLLWYHGEATKANELVPWVAQSYDVSPDGLTYTFHLRSGIKFTDGTPLDAQAVWYTYMRALIIDDPTGPEWLLTQAIRGGANYSKSYNNAGPSAPDGYGDAYTKAELDDFLNAKPIEVIDPLTVVFHLDWPYSEWPWIMGYVFGIVSPTAFKAHWTAPTDGTPYIDGATAGDYADAANPWPTTNMVGSGPYMLSSWDKGTGTVILVRNENYWGGPFSRGLAPIKNIIVKDITEPNTRVMDLKAGAADIADIPAAGGLIFQFVDRDIWLSQGRLKSLSPEWQAFPQCPPHNLTEGKCLFSVLNIYWTIIFEKINEIQDGVPKPQAFQPFEDIRIRKAFNLAFNRTAYYHDIMQGFVIPGNQLNPPGVFGYDPTVQAPPYDPEQAKQLLLDAGTHPLFPDNAFSPENSKTLTFGYVLGDLNAEGRAELLANTINSFASETGLYLNTIGMARVQIRSAARQRLLGLWAQQQVMDYPGPDNNLQYTFSPASNLQAMSSYNNSEVFRLVAEQARMLDMTERLKVISQITKLTNDDYAIIWQGYAGGYSISRSWLHERPNASIASGLETRNAGFSPMPCCFFYFSEIEKGESKSPASMQPSSLDLIQLHLILPVVGVFTTKKKF